MIYYQTGKERCVLLANYLIENQTTVRGVASHFDISKSTVHKDITCALERVNKPLFLEARKILEQNKQERHIRGGEATKRKYRRSSP